MKSEFIRYVNVTKQKPRPKQLSQRARRRRHYATVDRKTYNVPYFDFSSLGDEIRRYENVRFIES